MGNSRPHNWLTSVLRMISDGLHIRRTLSTMYTRRTSAARVTPRDYDSEYGKMSPRLGPLLYPSLHTKHTSISHRQRRIEQPTQPRAQLPILRIVVPWR